MNDGAPALTLEREIPVGGIELPMSLFLFFLDLWFD